MSTYVFMHTATFTEEPSSKAAAACADYRMPWNDTTRHTGAQALDHTNLFN